MNNQIGGEAVLKRTSLLTKTIPPEVKASNKTDPQLQGSREEDNINT